MNTKKLALLGIFVSQALILSIVESWIPVPVPVPGVKLGLANIITLVVILFLDFRDAVWVVVSKVAISSMFGGGFVVFLFSISGGLLSTVVMTFLHKKMSGLFSIVGISIAGSAAHNIGQILMASIVMRDPSVFGYLPVLLISGVIMGLFVGLITSFLSKKLQKTGILNKFK